MEETYDHMFTVTSQLRFIVTKEDDGVPVVCIVDHPAVKDFQALTYLVVHCEYEQTLERNNTSKCLCPLTMSFLRDSNLENKIKCHLVYFHSNVPRKLYAKYLWRARGCTCEIHVFY